jgi:hypothetical protein
LCTTVLPAASAGAIFDVDTSKARRAAPTAAAMSSGPPSATVVSRSPVAGLMTSRRAPVAESHQPPSM